jgi:hypothetical protein
MLHSNESKNIFQKKKTLKKGKINKRIGLNKMNESLR